MDLLWFLAFHTGTTGRWWFRLGRSGFARSVFSCTWFCTLACSASQRLVLSLHARFCILISVLFRALDLHLVFLFKSNVDNVSRLRLDLFVIVSFFTSSSSQRNFTLLERAFFHALKSVSINCFHGNVIAMLRALGILMLRHLRRVSISNRESILLA